jgi:hypothetical protein
MFAVVGPFLVYLDADVPVQDTRTTQIDIFISFSLAALLMYFVFKQNLYAQLL